MKKNFLVVLPKLTSMGGVSSFWNALLPVLDSYEDLHIERLEIGGHGKNMLGPFKDQWRLYKKAGKQTDLALLNPSLGKKSFFRDALFAKQLVHKKLPFVVFFHGWNLDFEKEVDKKYITFFMKTFGQAQKIFVLSEDFKAKILEWGYEGDVIIETTNIESRLIETFSMDEKLENLKDIEEIKILFLARLFKEKGIFELIDAFELLQKKYHHIGLTIAGEGKDYDSVKERTKNNSKIVVVGHVEGEEKIDLFKSSHIYCLPSYSEGLPTSVLEAMVFGLPVVTTEVGGLKAFFKNEKMGYFVKVKNIDDLMAKIEMLIMEQNRIIEMGIFNHKYACDKLLNTVVAERIYKHLKEG